MSKHARTPSRVEQAFDPAMLKTICEMPERDFWKMYDMEFHTVQQAQPHDFYLYKDNGSNILAVAHLDTVAKSSKRECNFVNTADGPVVFSRALDDRLGAYIILEMLPKLGITCDILLTTGEEVGRTTASFFQSRKDYNWIIEFDRGGTDVVLYQYEDEATKKLVSASGARVGDGIFSDISELDHLGVKAFNWGTGYMDYHTARSHAYLYDTFKMVNFFLRFHEENHSKYLEHIELPYNCGAKKNWWENDDTPTPVSNPEIVFYTESGGRLDPQDWEFLPKSELYALADSCGNADDYGRIWGIIEQREDDLRDRNARQESYNDMDWPDDDNDWLDPNTDDDERLMRIYENEGMDAFYAALGTN